MHDICQIADTPFDYQQYAREAELEQKTDHYLAQVQQDQRQQSPKQPKTIDCPDLAHASNQFLHLSPTQFSVYKLPSLTKLGVAERPDSSRIPHWAVHDQNYAYLNNRLAFFDNQSSTPTATNIHLPGASRFYRTADQLWSNMGAGLARIKLCGSKSKIQDKFLLDLGSYNALIDFYLLDKWALITSQQNHTHQDTSALQLVSLNTNRVFGFLKLKGNGYGVTGNQLVAFVANGSYGISVIDSAGMNDQLVRAVIKFARHADVPLVVFADGDHAGRTRIGQLVDDTMLDESQEVVWTTRPSPAQPDPRKETSAAVEKMLIGAALDVCEAACRALGETPESEAEVFEAMKRHKGSIGAALAREFVAARPIEEEESWPEPLHKLVNVLRQHLAPPTQER